MFAKLAKKLLFTINRWIWNCWFWT